MTYIRLRSGETKDRPELCVSIDGSTLDELSRKVRAAKKYGPGLIELRLDYMSAHVLQDKKAFERIGSLLSGNEILTLRSRKQGGQFAGSESLRLYLIERVVKELRPKLVDVELKTLASNMSAFDYLAKASKRTKVIASHHFFRFTPNLAYLNRVIDQAPDYTFAVKIACMATSFSDNLKVLSLYKTSKVRRERRKLIAFCMGPLGVFSRIACISLGSPLTYASLPEQEVAPGQLDVETMKKIIVSM